MTLSKPAAEDIDSKFALDGLDALFEAKSIAVFGASSNPSKIGGRPVKFLIEGAYPGAIYPINPKHAHVQGLPAFASLDEIEPQVDLAIIALPTGGVLPALKACAAHGVRAAVVFSAGFAEMGQDGADLQNQIRQLAQQSGMRVLGPNCIGAVNSRTGVYASFSAVVDYMSDRTYRSGVAFVSQSGAVGPHCLTVARTRGLDFQTWVTTGNEADIEFADCLAYLAMDDSVNVIAAYIEGCRDGDKLRAALSLARDRRKPVIVLKTGRSAIGAQAVASHTAALVGADNVYDALFDQYNVCRVESIEELIDTAYACSAGEFPSGNKIGLLTGSGGVGILMADQAAELGLDVAPLPEAAQRALHELWPPAGVINPVDTTAQATNDPKLFGQFLDVVLSQGNYDSVVVFLTYLGLLQPWADSMADALVQAKRRSPDSHIVVSMLTTPQIARRLNEENILVFDDPTAAVAAVHRLGKFATGFASAASRDVPIAPPVASTFGGQVLNEYDAKRLLADIGVEVVREALVQTPEEAAAAASEIGFPVVLKVVSADIQHKSEIGGVLLNIDSAEAAGDAYARIIDQVARSVPTAGIDGVIVAPMVTGGVETIIGVQNDPTFGPVVMFGLGGVFVEVLGDVTYRLAPFDEHEALEMIRGVKGAALLTGVRGSEACDLGALAKMLSQMSYFAAVNADRIASIDLNPVLAMPTGAVVLDALIIPKF
ncbi:MAG: acetate--CoA ligase family protein [Antricoccus sp.]